MIQNKNTPEFRAAERARLEKLYKYQELAEQYGYVAALNDDIVDSIITYTNSHKNITEALRTGQMTERYSHTIKNLDQAFFGVPRIKRPITLYRGINEKFDPHMISFISTSVSPYEPFNHMASGLEPVCCYLRILIPAGSKILPTHFWTKSGTSHEVLLPRNYGTRESNLVITNIGEEQIEIRATGETTLTKVYDITYLPEESIPLTNIKSAEDQLDEARLSKAVVVLYDLSRSNALITLDGANIKSNNYLKITENIIERHFRKFSIPEHTIISAARALEEHLNPE